MFNTQKLPIIKLRSYDKNYKILEKYSINL